MIFITTFTIYSNLNFYLEYSKLKPFIGYNYYSFIFLASINTNLYFSTILSLLFRLKKAKLN